MMKEISLQDCLIDVIDNRGVTPHKRGTDWKDAGIPVYSANNVKTTGIQKKDEIRYIDEKIYDSWMKIPLEKGDILLTSEAPAGEVFYWDSDDKIIVGQRLYGLKVKKSINSKYLKYYLQSSIGQKAILSQQSGSTVSGISAKTFSNIKIHLPEKKEQDNIGEFLYKLDKKIETNIKINHELESMAKTLYDYWFLQFDFPNEDGKPYKSSGGNMIWNDELKREIPDGWKVKKIGDILIEHGKSSIQVNEALQSGIYPFFTSGESVFRFNDFFAEGFNCFLNTGGNPSVKGYKGKCAYSTDTWCVSAEKYSYILYYYLLKLLPQFEQLFFAGSGLKHLQKEVLKDKYIVIPTDKYVNLFNKQVDKLWDIEENNIIQNEKISSLRDFLLPLLMNGQVTFKD